LPKTIEGVSGVLANRPEESAGDGFRNGSDGSRVEFSEGDGGVAEDAPPQRVGMEVAKVDEDGGILHTCGADGRFTPTKVLW